ncbi:hypothetical protein [Streptomyces sp. Qhu_M48]|uniref:hypothetical protein n=1 Tax=Streptomyces sp. Qhu_M48 TaxID=3435889 RepID=UPI003F50B929
MLVPGEHVFGGSSGPTSDALGVRWFAKHLGPYGDTVALVRLHERVPHLDCALGLIRDGLLVGCEEAPLDGVPDVLSEWDRAGVGFEAATLRGAVGRLVAGVPGPGRRAAARGG